MVSVLSLPNELWFEIFSWLASETSFSAQQLHSNLHNVALTHPHLNKCIQEELWSRVLISEDNFASRLAHLFQNSAAAYELERFSKELGYQNEGYGAA